MELNHQTLNERLGDRLPPEINAGYTIISRAAAGEDVVFTPKEPSAPSQDPEI